MPSLKSVLILPPSYLIRALRHVGPGPRRRRVPRSKLILSKSIRDGRIGVRCDIPLFRFGYMLCLSGPRACADRDKPVHGAGLFARGVSASIRRRGELRRVFVQASLARRLRLSRLRKASRHCAETSSRRLNVGIADAASLTAGSGRAAQAPRRDVGFWPRIDDPHAVGAATGGPTRRHLQDCLAADAKTRRSISIRTVLQASSTSFSGRRVGRFRSWPLDDAVAVGWMVEHTASSSGSGREIRRRSGCLRSRDRRSG